MSRLLTRREQIVLGFLAAALILGSTTVIALKRGDRGPQPLVVETSGTGPVPAVPRSGAAAAAPLEPAPPAIEVVVSIQGAVIKPGVYRMDQVSRVHDLIQAAGGLAPGARTVDINLAARLIDGTTLRVPGRFDPEGADSAQSLTSANPDAYTVARQASGAAPAGAGLSGTSKLINLNTASQAELETLPGIGPKLAQQMIQYRTAQPFRDVSELDQVSGIGPSRLESVREWVTVE
jgi:competence protein ComEA